MEIESIILFIRGLMSDAFTGRIIIDFHRGSISKKVKKETTELID